MNISEKQIEKFVRFPESLEDGERISIAKRITGEDQLEELASFYAKYDDLFKQTSNN